MNITSEQREIIKSILSGEIKNIVDYAKLFEYDSIDTRSGKEKMQILSKTDRDNYFIKLMTYEFTVNRLLKNELVYEVTFYNNPHIIFHAYNDNNSIIDDHIINGIIKNSINKNIYPTPDLEYFIENNYQTTDEILKKEEIIHRDKNYKLAKILAFSSIGISVIVTLFSALFQYYTYKNERKVIIMNNDKLDSLKIYGKIKIDQLEKNKK